MHSIVKLSNKKQIKRFYKSQHYSAAFIGFDSSYQVVDVNCNIIASVIVSYQIKDNQQAFLHALVVDKNFQNIGVAKQLIAYVCTQHNDIICFCSPKLINLYQQCYFNIASEIELSTKNKFRFSLYKNQQPLIVLRYLSTNI